MKIRIKGNSLRIRLSKPEVETFCREGYLEERTEFGESAFIYKLVRANNAADLNAGFENGAITMYVPAGLTKAWETNNIVGFDYTKTLPGGGGLFLLLEKDFKCIDSSVQEDQTDNFDNPLHSCS